MNPIFEISPCEPRFTEVLAPRVNVCVHALDRLDVLMRAHKHELLPLRSKRDQPASVIRD